MVKVADLLLNLLASQAVLPQGYTQAAYWQQH